MLFEEGGYNTTLHVNIWMNIQATAATRSLGWTRARAALPVRGGAITHSTTSPPAGHTAAADRERRHAAGAPEVVASVGAHTP